MQDRCMVWDEHTIGIEIFLGHSMELLGDVGQVEARCGTFGVVLTSTQDRCMVWDEHTIGLQIILGTLNGTPK
jgi:hypothetical protein